MLETEIKQDRKELKHDKPALAHAQTRSDALDTAAAELRRVATDAGAPETPPGNRSGQAR